MTAKQFIHLRAKTAYSLLEGAILTKDLVKLCVANNMPAIAVTDSDNLFGSLEFSQAAVAAGVQPIVGIQLSLAPMFAGDETAGIGQNKHAPIQPDQLLLYAKTEQGYHNLIKLASHTYLNSDSEDGLGPLVSYDTLAKYSNGLMALTAGQYGAVGRALLLGKKDAAAKAIDQLIKIFPDGLYVELMRHGLPEEQQIEADMVALAFDKNLPLIATNDVHFDGDMEMYRAHDALMCVSDGRYVSEENRRKLTPEHRFKTAGEMHILFADIPEALENTLEFAKRCAALSPPREPILPPYEMMKDGKRLSEDDALREQVAAGLQERLKDHVYDDSMDNTTKEIAAKPYLERMEFELGIIIEMGFPGYFLIVSDFISWAKEQDIPVGPGRGSGAASVVAWSLLITDIDPLKYDLVFERFLNPERVSMPDFDIDFCQDRREEVIHYVQKKYGYAQVAQIITFGKLQARAVLRDVGRVLQMPYNQVDRICKLVPANPANPVTLGQALDIEPELRRQMKDEEEVAKLIETALKLEGLYRHCSTHAAGVVIGDRPIDELVPLYRDPKSETPVVQYSMKYAEMAGLVKFDFLGLKTLSVLKTAVDFIARRDVTIDLLKVPLTDEPTYKLLGAGNTVGVFQFESAGMQDSLRKMQPDSLEDLIALAALYRPGPMDNIPQYIDCKHGRETPDYMHPALEPVLKETFGVIIYQEQVQRIAQVLAGYTLGGADLLRRAMGKKIKAEMDAQREKFVAGAKANKVDEKQANSIFDHVAKFAGYGFNKAHAAAYGFIGYQTAYLKANHPVEFIAASMAYDMHNTEKLAIFKEDASKMGIQILPPDINESFASFEVEILNEPKDGYDRAIRYALGALKNVGESAMEDLVTEREKNGKFKDMFDLMSRIDPRSVNKRQMENLIKSGTFDSLNQNRNQLFSSLEILLSYAQQIAADKESNQISLFGGGGEQSDDSLPVLAKADDWAALKRLEHEFKAVGFYLSSHPLEGYKKVLKRLKVTPYNELEPKLNSREYRSIKLAGIVTAKKVKTSDKGRFAFIQLSDASAVYEVSIFDDELLTLSRDLLENGTLVMVNAEAKKGDMEPRIIAKGFKLLETEAQKATSSEIFITIDRPDAITPIKALLGEPQNTGAYILITADLGDKRLVDIRISGRYKVPPQNILQLMSLQGVVKAEEI